jgi:hypothetical protein
VRREEYGERGGRGAGASPVGGVDEAFQVFKALASLSKAKELQSAVVRAPDTDSSKFGQASRRTGQPF